jgi:molybdopterin-guanine dinucleotide biosynthesis protein MobB
VASRIVCVVGRKNAGKTTLAVALAAEYVRRGRRVMTIKHSDHPAEVDRPGVDSWRHFNEGGVERTLLVAPDLRVLFERAPDDYDPVALARRYLGGADIIIAEGYKRARLPKIEVYRPSVASPPLYDPDREDAADWVGIVTDDPGFRSRCRVFRFSDTAWLPTLASLAWDGALEIAP